MVFCDRVHEQLLAVLLTATQGVLLLSLRAWQRLHRPPMPEGCNCLPPHSTDGYTATEVCRMPPHRHRCAGLDMARTLHQSLARLHGLHVASPTVRSQRRYLTLQLK